MKGFYGSSSYWTRNGRRGWANSKCFRRAFHSLQPFLVHGFSRRRKGCRRSPITKVTRGVCKDFIKIILELAREFQRLNFFFLRCSWFGKGLIRWILGCRRWRDGFSWWGALMVQLGLMLGLARIWKKRRVSLPSVGDRCANEPPAAISRSSAESMSKPV